MSLIGLGLVMFIKLTALKKDVISYRVGNESCITWWQKRRHSQNGKRLFRSTVRALSSVSHASTSCKCVSCDILMACWYYIKWIYWSLNLPLQPPSGTCATMCVCECVCQCEAQRWVCLWQSWGVWGAFVHPTLDYLCLNCVCLKSSC